MEEISTILNKYSGQISQSLKVDVTSERVMFRNISDSIINAFVKFKL